MLACDEAPVQVRVVWNLAHSLVPAWGLGRDEVKDLGRMDGEFPGVSLGLVAGTTVVLVGSGDLGDVTYGDSLVGRRWRSLVGAPANNMTQSGEGMVCEGQGMELRTARSLGYVRTVLLGF